jgi:diaminobutyrate-2-oxoglutarate transaminase
MNNYDSIFEIYESEVRSYSRNMPATFTKAKGSFMYDSEGREYIDFFNGAGALNYGHNNDYIKAKIIDYLANDGIIHGLDMQTVAKAEFISTLENKLLKPRGLDYKVQFTGPTGTNAVEAALKLARKVKKRTDIWCLMGCFHGMTLGALALTSQRDDRVGGGVPLDYVKHIPAPYMFPELDTIAYMRRLLDDDHSGASVPAAVIIETTQIEGGIWVMDTQWLKDLRKFCDDYDILLIVDDIQIGCGRSGWFFSFERAGIVPDIVAMSKSIGGFGLPLAIDLIKPELDIWNPGEHNGTFRGNQLAFIGGKAGIEFMLENHIEDEVKRKSLIVKEFLDNEIKPLDDTIEIRGIGLVWAIDVHDGNLSKMITHCCFEKGLVLERAGRGSSAVKIMPALTIDDETLKKGLSIVKAAMKEVLA